LSGREDAPSLLPGEVLGGKYRIEARLAEGGMGVVMRATHLDLDCAVAIKLLRSELSTNEDVVARLLAEARIAASLRSKHVNRVLDVGRTTAGVPYLVLEYLEGSDLGGYLERRGALPVSEAVDYLLQACEALAEAHAIGIVHRDLKPENLFLAEEADGGFVLKVLDFGISKAPASRRGRSVTNPFEVVGSPTYMSPEQVRGGNVDARTDVWAFGAVLHELCTGDIFFDEESITSTFKRILDPRDMPAPLEGGEEAARVHEIIVRCLQREPEQRFQDMVELAQALSPLGSDALQAARVAKVAAAARARVIAVGSANAPLAGTPLALTTSSVDSSLMSGVPPFAPKRRWRAWSIFAAAAVAAAVSGARHFTPTRTAAALPPTALVPTAVRASGTTSLLQEPLVERPAMAPVATPTATEPPRPEVTARPSWGAVPPARPTTPIGTPSTPTPTPAPALAHWEAARPQPSPLPAAEKEEEIEPAVPHAELAAREEAPSATPSAADVPPPTTTAPSHASFDAWDPTTFGGRK
jgi:serine/threonine-protein kinase